MNMTEEKIQAHHVTLKSQMQSNCDKSTYGFYSKINYDFRFGLFGFDFYLFGVTPFYMYMNDLMILVNSDWYQL